MVRKVSLKKFKLKTYRDLAKTLTSTIMSYASNASRVDIVFDVYKKISIKAGERSVRSAANEIPIKIKKDLQSLPGNMDMFWSSMENKIQIQRFFMEWMMIHQINRCTLEVRMRNIVTNLCMEKSAIVLS